MARRRSRRPQQRPISRRRKKWHRSWRRHRWKTIIYTLFILFIIPATYCGIAYIIDHRSRPQRHTIDANDYNGIDVSHHQGDIDWAAVARDPKIQFVYIKATEGNNFKDHSYKRNHRQARAQGIMVGAYHFFIASQPAEEQFRLFNAQVDRSQQDLIPMVDVEDQGIKGVPPAEIRTNLQRFFDLVKAEYGRYPLLYAQHSVYRDYLSPHFARYYLFIARYEKDAPTFHHGRCNIWQFTEQGHINGIKGHVDLDRFQNGTTLENIKL